MTGFGMAAASAGPHANNLHLAAEITTSTTHHSNFYTPDALPDAQQTVSKH